MATPSERLANYLRQSDADSMKVTFGEVEGLRGKPLPPSAYKYAAWWSNTRPHACWTTAGYKVANVSLTNRTLAFVRVGDRELEERPVRRSRLDNAIIGFVLSHPERFGADAKDEGEGGKARS